ncbi:hypothetical protein ACFQO4_20990 [Saliphagus sp. GCM10025334]
MSANSEPSGASVECRPLPGIRSRLSELEEEAANEQVETLLGVIDELVGEVRRLDARNRNMKSRLEKLEAVNGLDGDEWDVTETSKMGYRDKAVLRAIVASGDTWFSLKALQRLYRQHTDVRDSETLRKRIKHLTTEGPFESDRSGWEFTGNTD